MNKKTDSEDDCVFPDNIPPAVVNELRINQDPHSEADIARYLEIQSQETVEHIEKIKDEYVLGDHYEIWDVTTDKGKWWVLTNLTNLYSQEHFKSLDYLISFHVGLMMRLRHRNMGAEVSEASPFDEVIRRINQAREKHEQAVEAVDYQSVGMHLRECLISLITTVRRKTELEVKGDHPKDADVKQWSELIFAHYCGGSSNQRLRKYLKHTTNYAWELVNWLTHARNATKAVSEISIEACETVCSHVIKLQIENRTNGIDACPSCKSRNIRTHYDEYIGEGGDYFKSCGECDWSSYPIDSEGA